MTKLNQKGSILVFVFAAVGVVLFTVLSIVGGAQVYFQDATYSENSEVVVALAEAGIDKAVASLNKNPSYAGENETFLGNGSYSVTITSKDITTSIIQSTGYFPNKSKPKIKKIISAQVSKGVGISFVYGLLTGNGGITMGNGARINGSVYSNGNISGGNNETITGDTFVAGGTQPAADQQSDCVGSNCTDFIFGKSVSGNSQLDIAQSFKPSATAVINKISLKLKKIGSPPNLTVRILQDNGGSPDKNNVLTSGTLTANLVTSGYGFVDVTFSSSPVLSANTTYWILLDTSSNSSNYWAWSEDLAQGYNRGSPKWSDDWQAKNPSWNNINGDLGFQTWMGGVATSINMGNGSVISGNVHANTINGITVGKDAYYQVISNSTVLGVSYPNSADSPPIAMPISDANITDWKATAANYGVNNGDVSGCPNSLGPGKIVGNLNTSNNCTITVTTPIWITGNVVVGNSVVFKMDTSLGSSSGVMIVDGTTTFSNTDNLLGTGMPGSYLTLLSTYDSPAHAGSAAINTGNSSITGILYAPFGILTLANNATFKEAVAWQINMGTGTILTYDSGLISTFFSTGPSGSYTLIKGTYQEK